MQQRPEGVSINYVADELKSLLLNETLAMKRYGFDILPLPEASIHGTTDETEDSVPRYLLDFDKGQDVQSIIKNYATNASNAVLSIHKCIECLPQSRPFGRSTDVERLMLENLNHMKAILDADDASIVRKSQTAAARFRTTFGSGYLADQMGKRKSRRKPPARVKTPKLDNEFNCPFCSNLKCINIKLNRTTKAGTLWCRLCNASYTSNINNLTVAVDLYSEWIDACVAANDGPPINSASSYHQSPPETTPLAPSRWKPKETRTAIPTAAAEHQNSEEYSISNNNNNNTVPRNGVEDEEEQDDDDDDDWLVLRDKITTEVSNDVDESPNDDEQAVESPADDESVEPTFADEDDLEEQRSFKRFRTTTEV